MAYTCEAKHARLATPDPPGQATDLVWPQVVLLLRILSTREVQAVQYKWHAKKNKGDGRGKKRKVCTN